MKTISLKLPDGLDRQLTTVARTQRTTKSGLVRTALDAYLSEEIAKSPGSCLHLAGDLVGSVEAPADLSTGRQHMQGFGR